MACTVPGCPSRMGVLKENNGNISFHRFPTDIKLKETWTKNVRKGDDWRASQYTRICSIYFEDSCFREGYQRKILHPYAVPIIFPKLPPSCKPVNESVPKISCMTQTENDEGVSKLVEANKLIRRFKTLAERRGKKLKNLQRKFSRLTKKTVDLETIIQSLHERMESEHIAILKNTYNFDCDNQVVSKYLMKLQGASLPKEYPVN